MGKLTCIAAGLLACAVSAVAVDLPWVYDTSARDVTYVKSAASANHATAFASMAGHWSYESNASRLRTVKWEGVTVIVY